MAIASVAVLDGVESSLEAATVPLTDALVMRGDAAFETVGIWDGRPFRLDDHLARLDGSLRRLRIPPVDAQALRDDIRLAIERAVGSDGMHVGDALLRVMVSSTGTRVVMAGPQPVRPALRRLEPVVAPWIDGGWALAGAKTTSYAANMTMSRVAQARGADDALLVTRDGVVLEGPTFGVAWLAGDVLRMADVGLGIIDSISRRAITEVAEAAGMAVETGAWTVDDLRASQGVVTSSAVRPVQALRRVGEHEIDCDEHAVAVLADGLDRARRGPR